MLAVQTVNVLNDERHYNYNCCGKVPSFILKCKDVYGLNAEF